MKIITQEIFDTYFDEKKVKVYMRRLDLISNPVSGNKYFKLKRILNMLLNLNLNLLLHLVELIQIIFMQLYNCKAKQFKMYCFY